MTGEEVIDMQIAFYKTEFERIALILPGRKDNLSNLTEEATRYAHYIDALEGVKFILSGAGTPKESMVDVINEEIRQEKIIATYDIDIKQMADVMAHGDTFLAEELRSEMYIAVLSSKINDKSLNLVGARKKAVEYLDKQLAKKDVMIHGKVS